MTNSISQISRAIQAQKFRDGGCSQLPVPTPWFKALLITLSQIQIENGSSNELHNPPPRFKCISPSRTQHRKEDYVTPTFLSLSISPSFKESPTAPCFMIFLPLSRLRYLRTEGVWDIPRGSTNENQKHEASRARAQHLPLPAASNEVSTIRRKGAV